MPRYFQGRTLFGTTPVEASTAVTFRDVVDKLRICPTLPFRRADFFAMPKVERDSKKQVPYFVAAVFRTSPSARKYSCATVCNLIFLDLDELPDGTCPAKQFYDDPDLLFTLLGDLNFAAYLTASSTPEKPRMRIVVDAESIPVALYARAVATIGSYLGIPTNSESKVCVQAMFLPTMFQDSTEDEHPLLVYRIDGITFAVRDISEDLIPDADHEVARTNADMGVDALDYLRAPIPEITLTMAKDALECVDPDIGRKEWLEMAAALKHQFHPRLADEAYDLFDEWSSNGEKYGGSDDTEKMWASLRPTPIGRIPVTIRSLLRVATAAGWNGSKLQESCFNELLRWMETVATNAELMEKGTGKILALPMVTPIQEDALISELCKQAKRRFGVSISTTSCRKEIARKRDVEKSQEKQAGQSAKEPIWAKGVCYVAATGEFFRQRTGERYKTESFNATYSRWLLPTEDQLKESGIPVTPETLSTPIVSPANFALNRVKIPTFFDYTYDPSNPGEILVVDRGVKYVNTYSPSYPPPDNDGAEAAGKLLLNHISNLVLEPENRRILIDYLAFIAQNPGKKIRWTVLIQGAEGSGKTYIAKLMQAVLGYEHVGIISDQAVKSGWNEWGFGHQVVSIEEIYVAGKDRYQVMNAIKPLITNDEITILEKFRSARKSKNITNYILFSNHHNALAITPNDRRYFVIKSPLQTKAQVLELGENYFSKLFNSLRDHPGAMRSFLLNWEISPSFSPDGHAPRTSYVQDMVNDSASELTAAVRRILIEGDYPLTQYDIASAKTLLDCLLLEGVRVSAQSLGCVLREEGFRQVGRHTFGTERHYLWSRNGMSEKDAVEKATHRFKNSLCHLCMELTF